MSELPSRPVIYVDHRERLGGLIAKLHELVPVEVRPQWLPYGDLVVNDITIERKTTGDFVRSLRDGRLFRQVSALLAFSRRRLLLLEGISFPFDAKATESAVQGALLKIEAGMQVPVVQTQSVTDSALLISRLVQQELNAAKRNIKQQRERAAAKAIPRPQEKVLRSMRVTPGECAAILESFQTLRQIFNAPLEELRTVPGVSIDAAERLYRFATEVPTM